MSKQKDDLQTRLDAIIDDAASSDFPDTLSTSALVGETFIITSVELKTWPASDNATAGEGHVAQISSESLGEVEAWLTGSVLRPLLEAIEADGFPATVLLTRKEELFGKPYVLTSVS